MCDSVSVSEFEFVFVCLRVYVRVHVHSRVGLYTFRDYEYICIFMCVLLYVTGFQDGGVLVEFIFNVRFSTTRFVRLPIQARQKRTG